MKRSHPLLVAMVAVLFATWFAPQVLTQGKGATKPAAAPAKAAAPANLTFVTPKPGMALRAIQSLDVDLTDGYGNPVSDQPVVFSTRFGSVSPARVITDARGRAHTRWTPGSNGGKRILSAAVKGTEAQATFVLEPPPAAIVVKPSSAVKKVGVKRAPKRE